MQRGGTYTKLCIQNTELPCVSIIRLHGIMFISGMVLRCAGTLKPGLSLE